MRARLRRLLEEEGQDLTEYALLLILLVLAAVTSLTALAVSINGVFANFFDKPDDRDVIRYVAKAES